jgi:hypothetical protein
MELRVCGPYHGRMRTASCRDPGCQRIQVIDLVTNGRWTSPTSSAPLSLFPGQTAKFPKAAVTGPLPRPRQASADQERCRRSCAAGEGMPASCRVNPRGNPRESKEPAGYRVVRPRCLPARRRTARRLHRGRRHKEQL